MITTPEFIAAVERLVVMQTTMGEDHPLTLRALALVVDLAPDDLKAFLTVKMRDLELIPDADGYLEDGTPVYRLESIAQKMGMIESDAQSSVQAFMADRVSMGLDTMAIDPALIHRTQ
jgi:hypothetical protein